MSAESIHAQTQIATDAFELMQGTSPPSLYEELDRELEAAERLERYHDLHCWPGISPSQLHAVDRCATLRRAGQ